jgi:NAD(P)-dependent dehydrogenase (short-subunit alcohol dehydrogenase family)
VTAPHKTAVVTGATAGIGAVTARELARAGMRTIVVARDREKGQHVVDDIRAATGNANVELALCDFTRLADVRALAAELHARTPRIDVLVNNVGGMFLSRRTTHDGFEMTFGLNHLAPFLLTTLVLDLVKAAAPSRIVNVASAMHASGRLDFADLGHERRYSAAGAYAASKLANVLFTRELARRLEGTGVTVNAVHPGTVATSLGKNSGSLLLRIGFALGRPFMKTPEQGARTSVWAATAPELAGVTGKYFAAMREVTPSKAALDDAVAARLWTVSEELVAPAPAR